MRSILAAAAISAALLSPAAAQNTFPASNPGDMIVKGTVGAWDLIPGGTAGCVLTSNGPTAKATWQCALGTGFSLPPMPTNRVWGNVSGTQAIPTAITINQWLDTIGYDTLRTPTNGSLIAKDPATGTWQALVPVATSGWVLTNNGTGQLPRWAPSNNTPFTPGLAGTCLASNGVGVEPSYQACLLAANNLSDLASTSMARTNLGLGTMAVQAASSVAITGGTITGLSTPTATTDATNKAYVDLRTGGSTGHPTVYVECSGTDDTTALAAAKTTLTSAGGGTLVLPMATCIVASATALQFTAAGNYVVRGYGKDSIVKAKNSAAITLVGNNSSTTSFLWSNFVIDGNVANGGVANPAYGLVVAAPDSVVDNVEIKNAWQAIAVGNDSTTVRVRISNNYLHDNQIVGLIQLGATYPKDVLITNNRFERNYNTTTLSDSSGINFAGEGVTIIGNFFKDNYNINGGQLLLGGTGACLNGTIVGNVIEQTGTFQSDVTVGIEVACTNVTVVGNVVTGATGWGVQLEADKSDIIVSGNELSATLGGIFYFNDAGVSPKKVSIRNNHIKTGAVGISFDAPSTNCCNVYIQNNTIDPAVTTAMASTVSKAEAVEGNTRGDWQAYTPTIGSATGAPGSFTINYAQYVKGASYGQLAVQLTITTTAPATTFVSVSLPWTTSGPCTFTAVDNTRAIGGVGWSATSTTTSAFTTAAGAIPIVDGSVLYISGNCRIN